VTSPGTVAKYLREGWDTVSRERSLKRVRLKGRRGLCSRGVPLEVWVGHDAPTFNTAHLTGLVFLLRDAIGDQATVRTSVRRPH
jgi:hypothetical protein